MNITIVGIGYVGLSMAVLLSQKNKVIALDISEEKVAALKQWRSPLADECKACPAVFLDRDGVLTIEKKTILHPSQVELCEGAADCVRRLKDAGYIVIVITNQSGVARGLFTEEELIPLHEKLKAETGVDEIYYCPHHKEGSVPRYSFVCECRKPKTGMIEKACRDFNLDLSRSWIVGDRESDILTGRAAGLKTILVRCGYGEDELARGVTADAVAADLTEAVERILESRGV